MVWEDHLWDGNRCLIAKNRCCDRFGWFSREVDPSSNFIEVQFCSDESRTIDDVLADQLEIWVM